jgi:hypothetical protein
VAIVADGLDAMHGVSAAVRQIRERGVRDFEVEVIGADCRVDRRLGAVAEFEVPFYPGLRLGVPSLLGLVETLVDGGYDLVHVCTPGPTGLAAAGIAPRLGIGLVGSHHTELGAYASLRSGRPELAGLVDAGLRAFLGGCQVVLSPSPASDERLADLDG